MLHKKKRIISILLALVMVLTMLPMTAVPAAAAAPYTETIEVGTWSALSNALENTAKNNVLIKLKNDISYNYEYPNEYKTYPACLKVQGIKALDLNGLRLEYVNKKDYVTITNAITYLFEIPSGASLHILDSKGSGVVQTDGYMTEGTQYRFDHANIFKVDGGTLVIDSGAYYAGRSKKVWASNVRFVNNEQWVRYNGYAYRMIGGTVITNNSGKVVINGGNFNAIGSGTAVSLYSNFGRVVLDNKGTGQAVINGGYMLGYAGASVMRSDTTAQIIVNGGTFDTTTRKVLVDKWAPDGLEFYGQNVRDSEGVINLPKENINPRFSGYHYDGRDYLPGDMDEDDFLDNQQILKIYPGEPVITLAPEVEDDLYIISKDSPFTISATVEPYFTDLGLYRQSDLHYSVVENSQVKDWDANFNPETSTIGFRDYYYQVTETLPGQGNADPNAKSAIKPFSVYVVAEDLKPVVTITASKNPAKIDDYVTLTATTDQDNINSYTWYQIDGTTGTTTVVGTGSIYRPSADKAGEYIYRCEAQGLNATGTSPSFIFKVALDMEPSIAETALYLKKGVPIDGTILPRNIGGAVDEWTFTGTLPAGVVQRTLDAGFSGTPTEAGEFPIELTAKNDFGSDTKKVTIYVSSSLDITTTSFPDAVIGTPYGRLLDYTGSGDIKWSLEKGVLPPGLGLRHLTYYGSDWYSEISGTPTDDKAQVDGKYEFTIKLSAPGETTVTKDFSITLRKAPKYPKSVSYTVPLREKMIINSPLIKGDVSTPASMPLTFTLSNDAPEGLYIDEDGQNSSEVGHLMWDNPVARTYSFILTATNGYGSTSTEVELTVADKPMFSTEPNPAPWGEVNREYNYTLKGIPTGNVCVYELTSNSNPLPAGLTLDSSNGVISGTPTTASPEDSNGSLVPTIISVQLRDTQTGLSETRYPQIGIYPENSFKAPTDIEFDKTTFSSNTIDGAVITTGAVPAAKITLVSGELPNDYDFLNLDKSTSFVLQTIYNGTYNFKLRAESSEGYIEKDFTIAVVSPDKADPPTTNPAAGLYKKGDTVNVKLDSDTMGIYYSIDGKEMEPWSASDETNGIDITQDTVIKAYSTNYGFEKLDSDVVEFKYIFVNDPSQIQHTTSITTSALPDGTIGNLYTATQLQATTTSSQPINWVANGLPTGMALSADGKLSGTPTEAGTFNVDILATAETSDSKTLTLKIAQEAAATPAITTHPSSATYKLNGTASPLTVEATSSESDGGTISYRWYRSNDESNSTKADDVMVGAGDSFTPPTSSTQTHYYYALAVNRKAGYEETSVTSDVAKITILYDAATPTFDDMADLEYTFTEGTQAVLMQSADVQDNGTLTYKWYRMTGEKYLNLDKDVVITGGTDGELEIITAAAPSINKYYAVVTNTNNNATGDKVKTEIGPIHVVNSIEEVVVTDIKISKLPDKTVYTAGENFDPTGMVVTASYSDSSTAPVTTYTVPDGNNLAAGKTTVTISYTEDSVTKTATQNITVNPVAPSITGVTVSPTVTSIQKGNSQTFTAAVTGTGSYDNTVTWSVTGGIAGTSIDADGILTVDAAETATTLTVTATANGDNSKTASATVTVTDKKIPVVTPNAITVTYTGTAVADSEITGTATFGESAVAGAWSFDGAVPVNAGTHTVSVLFTPTDTTTYATVGANLTLTINKATPTGTPAYTAITQSGKSLADAALTVGSITLAGTIAWNSGAATAVVANTSYSWTFTPSDTANYNTLTGSIAPYVVSSGGGGGGGSTVTPPVKQPNTSESGDWNEIKTELSETKPGETVTVNMNGATQVPKEIFDEIAGKDITVEFKMDNGISWSVNGEDIPEGANLSDLDLGVTIGGSTIPATVINQVTGETPLSSFPSSTTGRSIFP